MLWAGALWIWNLAPQECPGAIQILDIQRDWDMIWSNAHSAASCQPSSTRQRLPSTGHAAADPRKTCGSRGSAAPATER